MISEACNKVHSYRKSESKRWFSLNNFTGTDKATLASLCKERKLVSNICFKKRRVRADEKKTDTHTHIEQSTSERKVKSKKVSAQFFGFEATDRRGL